MAEGLPGQPCPLCPHCLVHTSGRRNVSLFTLDGASPGAQPAFARTVWWAAGGYSAFDTTGGAVRLLYEAGNNVYDWGIKLSTVELLDGAPERLSQLPVEAAPAPARLVTALRRWFW